MTHPGGRPTTWTDADYDEILDRVAAGEFLREIEREYPAVPRRETVLRKIQKDGEYGIRYARAREMQAHAHAERAVMAARAATPQDVQAARLLFDAERWIAGKLAPREYGDRTVIAGDPNNPLVVQQQAETRAELIRRLSDMARPEPLTIEAAVVSRSGDTTD